jgi:hypothetical protein
MIGQDIVDSIVENLPDDVDTLKQCCLVSQSFSTSSQRQLFSRISLGSSHTKPGCRCLYRLLINRSHIVPYIRELHVDVKTHPQDKDWIYQEETFPHLLQLLMPSLRAFSLVAKYDTVVWDRLSFELHTSLLDLFTSPSLTSIRLINICANQFPLTMLCNQKQLKRIGFVACYHPKCRRPVPPIPAPSLLPRSSQNYSKAIGQLDAIELSGNTSKFIMELMLNDRAPLKVSPIRKILVDGWTWVALTEILKTNRDAMQNIESFMCRDSRLAAENFNLTSTC